jgi:beta-galactosidase
MKTKLFLLAMVVSVAGVVAQSFPVREGLFDDHWRFYRGGAQRAEQPEFDDSQWQIVNLPHDWSIEDPPGTGSPFDVKAISQVSGGFTTGGTGWYRKSFAVPDHAKGKIATLKFDGVYMNAECWLNGHYLGDHPYGYTSFYYDVTSLIRYGDNNLLAVKVKNEGENSRWYSGSGIYRHVWLSFDEQVHVTTWGIQITTPDVTEKSAEVVVKTNIINQSNKPAEIRLVTRIKNRKNEQSSPVESVKKLDPGEGSEFLQRANLTNPEHWSPEDPALYTAVSEVYSDNVLSDTEETIFGVRKVAFSATEGFTLNGKPLKMKGACFHHDNGPLGARAYDRAEERKVELLKASGFNAVRCSHNPPSPAFLDACDRLGMLVIDEAFDMWADAKNPYDYHLYFRDWWQRDIKSMVLRDFNHPSVIMWSIGNEIPNRHTPEVVEMAKKMRDYAKGIDPSRTITAAVNDLRPDKDPYFAVLDIAGYNYAAGGDHLRQGIYAEDHARIPERIMMGTESYPLEAFQSWMDVIDHPWVIGDFVWTGFDYIGEASIGWRGYWQEQSFFPWNLAYCGDIDICGWKRPQSFYRDVLWKADQLSVFVTPPVPSFAMNPNRQSWSKWHWYDAVADWNWEGYENRPLEVVVYSSCEKVELFLNDKSLGIKNVNRESKFMASWQVAYQAGVLKAVGFRGKKAINTAEIKTSQKPALVRLLSDRSDIQANNQDLCYITVELTDANGIRDPKAGNLVKFEIEGPGTIIGVGNANPVSLESYTIPQRKAWQGRCLVVVKAGKEPGKVVLKATVEGLQPAVTEINVIIGNR